MCCFPARNSCVLINTPPGKLCARSGESGQSAAQCSAMPVLYPTRGAFGKCKGYCLAQQSGPRTCAARPKSRFFGVVLVVQRARGSRSAQANSRKNKCQNRSSNPHGNNRSNHSNDRRVLLQVHT